LRTGADPAHGALEAACIHAGGCQVDDAGILICSSDRRGGCKRLMPIALSPGSGDSPSTACDERAPVRRSGAPCPAVALRFPARG
jgi:hypothetical protein